MVLVQDTEDNEEEPEEEQQREERVFNAEKFDRIHLLAQNSINYSKT